jgi:hypothetical protein
LGAERPKEQLQSPKEYLFETLNQMLDFSSDASAKVGNITINVGDLWSGNKTNVNVQRGPQRKASGGRIGGSNWNA